ncbi:hypothetical protein, partial [Arcanobacterium phocae]|uniref:hypothetical protein n=1 Tax=Arcanobacterium phocae TaxID=131112 RepID=UPI001C0EFCCD
MSTTCWRRVSALPFDFDRRRAAVLAEKNGQKVLIVKGAPEAVLSISSFVEDADSRSRPLDRKMRTGLEQALADQARSGFRLLAVACKPWSNSEDRITQADEREMAFIGFCAFLDPPKASASGAIARLRDLQVRVKIISGDAAPVVLHLVETLKLASRGLLTGDEIDA